MEGEGYQLGSIPNFYLQKGALSVGDTVLCSPLSLSSPLDLRLLSQEKCCSSGVKIMQRLIRGKPPVIEVVNLKLVNTSQILTDALCWTSKYTLYNRLSMDYAG